MWKEGVEGKRGVNAHATWSEEIAGCRHPAYNSVAGHGDPAYNSVAGCGHPAYRLVFSSPL